MTNKVKPEYTTLRIYQDVRQRLIDLRPKGYNYSMFIDMLLDTYEGGDTDNNTNKHKSKRKGKSDLDELTTLIKKETLDVSRALLGH